VRYSSRGYRIGAGSVDEALPSAGVWPLTGAVLAEVVKNHPEPRVRRFAVLELTDYVVLAEFAGTDASQIVRAEAAEKVNAQIAKIDVSSLARRVAVEKLTDQTLLAQIAEADDCWLARSAAMNRIRELKESDHR
jgi:hypothetical protein